MTKKAVKKSSTVDKKKTGKKALPFKKNRKKTGGRKKGMPNKINREIKDIFGRLLGFITDEDLYTMYKKFKKKPDLFLKILQMIYPKDMKISVETKCQPKVDIKKLTEKELKEYLKLTRKLEDNATDNA